MVLQPDPSLTWRGQLDRMTSEKGAQTAGRPPDPGPSLLLSSRGGAPVRALAWPVHVLGARPVLVLLHKGRGRQRFSPRLELAAAGTSWAPAAFASAFARVLTLLRLRRLNLRPRHAARSAQKSPSGMSRPLGWSRWCSRHSPRRRGCSTSTISSPTKYGHASYILSLRFHGQLFAASPMC